MTSAFHIRRQLLSDILCNDVADLVNDYIGIHHLKEWTVNLMRPILCGIRCISVCTYINPEFSEITKKYGRYVNFITYIANKFIDHRHYIEYSTTINTINKHPVESMLEEAKKMHIIFGYRPKSHDGKPLTVKKPPHIHCQECHRKNEPIFEVYRIGFGKRMMCARCDPEKKYTVRTKKGFRSIPTSIQAKIVFGINTPMSLAKIYASLSSDEKVMSYSTLCRWSREKQMC